MTARILHVVDVFDALTTDRPYRRAMPRAAALETLEAEARRGWWDRAMVRAFREVADGAPEPGMRMTPVRREARGTPRGEGTPLRALAIDDNAATFDFVRALLEAAHCEVHAAALSPAVVMARTALGTREDEERGLKAAANDSMIQSDACCSAATGEVSGIGLAAPPRGGGRGT